MVGRKLLHFEIESKLGEGGMGAVYKARDCRLGRDVALKFLPSQVATPGSVERARFEVEARAAAALNHPNVAVIHAIEEGDEELFLVMEYVEGMPLRQRIDGGGLPLDQVLRYATQIASGLQAAHDKGIVHRDIKSSNLMVTPDGAIKILDFGLARFDGDTHITRSGTTFGTAAYMSPEQVRGEPADARSDIWALGVVLYEMLTGQTPFRAEHAQAELYAIVNTDPPPPSSLASVPARLDRLVRKALSKSRETRYARVAEVIADLSSIAGESHGDGALGGGSKNPMHTRPPALAVLPFASIKSDPETDFLGFALADQVIGSLKYVTGLVVRPSSSVRRYVGQNIDARTVANDLQVAFLLTGFYLKQDDALRLNVELVDVRLDEMVWRDAIHVRYESAFELQDLVAQKVLDGLAVRFSSRERERMRADVPTDPLAYEYYLRAVSYPLTTEGNRLAATMAEQSIALDPEYAPAWVELGYRLEQWATEVMAGKEAYARSEAAYRQALTLNANLVSALWMLASCYVDTARPEEAAQLLERTFEITPNSAEAHSTLGYLYRYTGMLDEAVREVDRARELDPRNSRLRNAGFTYIYRGDYQKAYDTFALDQEGTVAIAWRGMALYLMGDRDRALEHFDRAAQMEPENYVGIRHAAIAAYIRGDRDHALELLRNLENRIPKDHDPEHWYLLATAYGLIYDAAGCVRALEKAVAGGFFNYPCFVRDPLLDCARGDAEFERVLGIAKLRHEKFKQRALELERAIAVVERRA